jgi:sigma-B regulation protein RsbU (phosphoserine phosphatase)
MVEHILVVDDEPDLEIMVSQRLRKKIRTGEYILHFVFNGQEALDKLDEVPQITLVITDISMPVMSGLELLHKIKEKQNPMLKVIIVSAFGDMGNIRFALNNGAFDFLTKPLDLDDFEKTIEKTLQTIQATRKAIENKKRIDNYDKELLAAREIQLSIIPKVFPPFPDIKEFDIYGRMEAAELVGGDFFDFFLISEDKVGFVIGDVSGKGIPASIFMAVSRTIIHSLGCYNYSADECLRNSNKLLYDNSIDSMFVTAFYGILNYKTGELRYTNAGHNYPYVLTPDGNVQELNTNSSVMLGVFDDAEFKENVLQLKPKTFILLYTDGVNEAMNKNKQILGNEALLQYLTFISVKDTPKNMTNGIFNLVKQHSCNCEQSDDITVLTLAYYGNTGCFSYDFGV